MLALEQPAIQADRYDAGNIACNLHFMVKLLRGEIVERDHDIFLPDNILDYPVGIF
jgi:hypothetical protein